MARVKGNSEYPGSVEVLIAAPFDARRVVQLKSDLINPTTWIWSDGNKYIYKGLDVIVCGDTDENNGIYVLMNVGNYQLETSWEKKTGSTSITIPNIVPKGNYDETPDVVYNSGDMVNIGGIMYICTEDGTTNIKPTVTAGWQDKWAIFQLKGSDGKAGEAPYINATTGEWNIVKPDGTIHNFQVKAIGVDGLTPRIQDGFWYIGDKPYGRATGTKIEIRAVGDTYNWFLDGVDSKVQAIGEPGKAAIANINLCGNWNSTTTYTNQNARTGKTDVVLGSDNKMYAALVDGIVGAGTNPVNDTTNKYWGLFAMYGSDGKTGDTPYIKDGFWYIGTETVNDKTTGQAIRATGSLITISSDGYWEIDGYKTEKKASIETIIERQISKTENITNIVENTINNINPRGVFDPLQTYYHTNVDQDNKTDVVVGSDGRGYFCLAESTSVNPVGDTTQSWALFSIAGTPGDDGDTPELIPDAKGNYWWYIGGNNQWVKANGKDGESISGTNGRDPYIRENGMWAFQRLSLDGKTVIEDIETNIKAKVDQPNIREGMWFVGDTPTFVQARGESAIANINFREAWKVGEQYWNKNANANNWTDLVDGADDNKYYCKVNHTSSSANNPCIQVDGVWVRNTSTEATSKWGKWSIKGSTGADGKPAIMRWFDGKLQWKTQGTSTWNDLMNASDIRRDTLSDISTPIGSVIMYAGKAVNIPTGYLLADGRTIQKTEYPELVEKLSGSNVATSASLPDLCSRFIVGYDPNDTDYNTIGKNNSKDFKTVQLTDKQSALVEHDHLESISSNSGSGKKAIHNSNLIGTSDQYRSQVKTGKESQSLAEESHENRPPYYVLAYIVKASYIGEIRTPYDTYKQTLAPGITPMTPEEWLETMRGETGVAGFNYRYDYVNSDTYNENDVVRSLVDGNAYYCKVDGTKLKEPSTNPTEWTIFVMRGAQGAAAPQVLIRYSTSSSTAEGSDWHTPPTLSDVYARFSTDNGANYGSPIKFKGETGASAYPIKIQYSADGTIWSETASATSKYLQFSTDNGTTWSSTISISGGSSVFTQDITVNLSSGKLGKYSSGQTIIAANKTFEEVLRDIAIESIAPIASITASRIGGIPYNHPLTADSDYAAYADTKVTLNLTASSQNGGSINKYEIWYRRVGQSDSSWVSILNTGTATSNIEHSVKALLGADNVTGIEYKFKATDTVGATKEVTASITPNAYTPALYAKGTPAYSLTREIGNVSTRIVGTISFDTLQRIGVSQYASITSRTLYYRINADTAWTAISAGTLTNNIDYTHDNIALKDAYKIEYQLVVVSTKPSGATHTATFSTTDLGGTITLSYNFYYGVGTAAPTAATDALRRDAVKNSNPLVSATGTSGTSGFPYLYTGTSAKIWICLPPGRTLSLTAYDVSANANFVFGTGTTYLMNDAGENQRSFTMYEATSGFSTSHQIRITIS